MPIEKLQRKIIFWTLVCLFFISATYIVFYARGYRFNFQRWVFVYSGSITIKSNPQKVDVDIDGKIFTSKKLNRINSSYGISGLIPDDYLLTVKAEGFKDWSKKVDVHSGLSTEFWNVLLVKNEYEKTAYDCAKIKKFFISPKSGRLIFVADVAGGFSAKILDIENNTIENNFTFARWNFVDDAKKENIEWSPKEDYLSVPVQKNSGGKIEYAYFILNPSGNEQFNLNDFLAKPEISHVRWDPADKRYLFFLSAGTLYRANIEQKEDITLIAENVSSFDLSKTGVYFLEMPNQLVFKKELDGQSEKTQITQNFPGTNNSESEMFVVYDDARIAFLNKEGDLVIFNDGASGKFFNKLAENVVGFQFSDDGKKLLYWTKNEISVHFLRDWGVQPFRSENETANITRYAGEIRNIQWFNADYEHIIFSIDSKIKIIELDPRDQRNCADLQETTKSNPFLIYNNTLEKLIFIDENELSDNLFSIDFPEKTTILGL
jgi:hypothetical protein